MTQKIVQLFSPGLDSFMAYYFLKSSITKSEVKRVYFDLNCRYSKYEVEFLKRYYTSEEVEIISNVIDLGKYEREDAYIPNRNLLLVSLAQGIFDADIIYLNGVKDDRVSDNTSIFRKTLSEHLSIIAEKEIQVKSVFENYEKSQAVREYIETIDNNPIDLLTKTFSCYNKELYLEENLSYFKKNNSNIEAYLESGKIDLYGCLECPACYRRLCALTYADIYVPFFDYKISKKYFNEVIEQMPNNLKGKRMNVSLTNRSKTIMDYHHFLTWMGCD